MQMVHMRQDQEQALGLRMRALWEEAHGAPPGDVRLLIGSDSLAVWIEDVLSPAEQAATRQQEGQRLIHQYAEQLLAAIRPELWAAVESIAGRRIVSGNTRADVDTGHVLCFFVLGERLADSE